MARMSILHRLRDVVRRWLGIDELASKGLIQAREKADRERHAAILEVLNRIEKKLTAEHLDHPRQYTPPVLDWDTVQAIAMQALEDPKEPS